MRQEKKLTVNVLHRFKDGGTDPAIQTVPAKSVARLGQILTEARKKQATA